MKPKAFDLLVFLVERPGRLIPKQELLEALWAGTFVEEANLTYTVSTLRRALGDGQEGDRFIQTVPYARLPVRRCGGPSVSEAIPPGDSSPRRRRSCCRHPQHPHLYREVE